VLLPDHWMCCCRITECVAAGSQCVAAGSLNVLLSDLGISSDYFPIQHWYCLFNKTNLCTIIIKHTKTLSLLKFKMLYVSRILILNPTCFDHHMTIIRGILVLRLATNYCW
jgi:hypothetical protein